ncbi:MAG: hypothetical protein PHS14_12995 [Elusimicrobia bacterium]|nr:hypothetical protein [Elusimicrobiota bacterium]
MSETKPGPELTVETQPPPKEKGAAALVAIGERGVMLRSLEDLLRFARMCVAGGAAPKGMTEGAAALAIQAGLERGLGPLGGLQNAVVINGVLSWRGQGAAALIQNSGVCRPGTLRFGYEGEADQMRGYAVAHRLGYAQPDRREFTVADARRGGLWGKEGPWKAYPHRMLAWRALGLLARDVFPDVLGGFPLAEEAEDFTAEAPARGPAQARPAPPPPSAPDPLMSALGVVEAQVVPAPPEAPVESPSPGAPFSSHAEADAAIAEAEGQGDLFRKE